MILRLKKESKVLIGFVKETDEHYQVLKACPAKIFFKVSNNAWRDITMLYSDLSATHGIKTAGRA